MRIGFRDSFLSGWLPFYKDAHVELPEIQRLAAGPSCIFVPGFSWEDPPETTGSCKVPEDRMRLALRRLHDMLPSFHTPCLWRFGLPGSLWDHGNLVLRRVLVYAGTHTTSQPQHRRMHAKDSQSYSRLASYARVSTPGNHANGQRHTTHPDV